MIRKHKQYAKPRKMYDSARINAENEIVKKYGLKNKREIWKIESHVKYLRSRAKSLTIAPNDEQEKFFVKLRAIGLSINSIADVLALTKDDLLKRRLSTIIAQKKLAQTTQQARQMIVHRKVLVGEQIVNVPSYIVRLSDESRIRVVEGKNRVVVSEKNTTDGEANE